MFFTENNDYEKVLLNKLYQELPWDAATVGRVLSQSESAFRKIYPDQKRLCEIVEGWNYRLPADQTGKKALKFNSNGLLEWCWYSRSEEIAGTPEYCVVDWVQSILKIETPIGIGLETSTWQDVKDRTLWIVERIQELPKTRKSKAASKDVEWSKIAKSLGIWRQRRDYQQDVMTYYKMIKTFKLSHREIVSRIL